MMVNGDSRWYGEPEGAARRTMHEPDHQTGSVFSQIQSDRSRNLLDRFSSSTFPTKPTTYASMAPAVVPAISECSGGSFLLVMVKVLDCQFRKSPCYFVLGHDITPKQTDK